MCCFLARVLLVDYSSPLDADTCEYLHDALVNFFSLVTHLSGPCRTPFFGLFALTDHPEVSMFCSARALLSLLLGQSDKNAQNSFGLLLFNPKKREWKCDLFK